MALAGAPVTTTGAALASGELGLPMALAGAPGTTTGAALTSGELEACKLSGRPREEVVGSVPEWADILSAIRRGATALRRERAPARECRGAVLLSARYSLGRKTETPEAMGSEWIDRYGYTWRWLPQSVWGGAK